jgi:FRG domain
MPSIDPIWLDLIELVSGKSDGSWIFRGQEDKDWKLKPKVGRPDICGTAGYRQADERVLFDDFRREAKRFERGYGFEILEWLALAQHFGLPTRLLDWTTNPLTAAWFAVANEHQSNDGRIHMVRYASHSLSSNVDPYGMHTSPILTRVPPLAARITSQQGLFSVHPDPTLEWAPSTPFAYEVFDIPGASKAQFRRLLHFLGFNSSRLMSDLDGLCRTLQWEYHTRT